MKLALIFLGLLVLASTSVRAQCKDCGCKAKCSTTYQCKHGAKPEAP
jgi:hypothetical protein